MEFSILSTVPILGTVGGLTSYTHLLNVRNASLKIPSQGINVSHAVVAGLAQNLPSYALDNNVAFKMHENAFKQYSESV
jgi:hypothetical protein